MSPKSDTSFLKAFSNLIGVEGGFTDNPKDDGNWTGGKQGSGMLKGTKYGIAAASYPHLDIPNLTLEQAQELYYKDFWLACKADKLPFPIANALFDCAVNSGVRTAVKLLQRACGVAEDGVIGAVTIEAASKEGVLIAFMTARAMFYTRLAKFELFGKGWMKRLFIVHQQSIS